MFAREGGGQGDDTGEAKDTDFTISLPKVNGQPGTEVSLPVLFSRKTDAPNVTALRVRLRYTGGILKYVRTEDAYLSRRAQMKVQAKELSGSEIEMNVELPDPQHTGFPSGQIATIFFKIADGAPDGVIPVPTEAWIDGKQVMPGSATAKVEPGEVSVSQTPVFVSCFFFTH